MPLTVTREIQIEFGDCDPAGIVYYPNYFRIFDNCTAGLFAKALGEAKPRWLERFGLLGIPMVDTQARFHRPATHGDVVRVETTVTAIGRSSLRITHRLFHGTTLAVEGTEVRVCVTGTAGVPETIRALPVPDALRRALGHPAGQETAGGDSA